MSGPDNANTLPVSQAENGIRETLDQVWSWFKAGKTPQNVGRDGFPVFSDDPWASTHAILNDYLQQIQNVTFYPINARDVPAGKNLLTSADQEKLIALRALIVRIAFYCRKQQSEQSLGVRFRRWVSGQSPAAATSGQPADPDDFTTLVGELFRTDLRFTEADLLSFVNIGSKQGPEPHLAIISNDTILRALERYSVRNSLSPELQEELQHWRKKLQSPLRISGPARKLLTRIDGMLGHDGKPTLQPGEPWSDAALEDLNQLTSDQRSHWLRLLCHCQKAETSKPTQKWTKSANEFLDAVGREEFKQRVLHWFDLVALPKPNYPEHRVPHTVDPAQLLGDTNSVILKGLAWCCAGWKDEDLSRAVSRLAQVCFKKVRNLGARCPRVANACVYSLSATPTEAAAAELTRLDQVVKQPSAKKLVGKSLDKAAEMTGQTREDLEESTVPNYGLDASGCLRQTFGDFTAEYRIAGPDAGELLWRKADGKLQKSVPAEVKEQHTSDLKVLKRTIQDIEKMLPAQRQRIEHLFISEREWEFEKWRERYLDHPLLAHLSRRLIWHFRDSEHQAAAIWSEGKLVESNDQPLDWLSSITRVRLWHPLGQELAVVANWRRWLETHQVSQPFKQAHREIYILTDAEQQTATYSNRFAAHIIRQHQFTALTRERGWTYRLQGDFDSHNVPTLLLPKWDLAVEFWVESVGGDESTSERGLFIHVSTDQVRFCDPTGTPRLLSEVPALVFSEAMRDVDLFVGVCSIGNDPEWHNRGEAQQFGPYWQTFSFGELSVTAKTRREVLQKLLPRLKIAGQCSLTDKFLVVRGTLRTYKIHLGSANILMEPNDRYLCIVPERGRASSLSEKVFLPFEGDNTLAVILSKAFLLSEDSKIKDSSILSQIRL